MSELIIKILSFMLFLIFFFSVFNINPADMFTHLSDKLRFNKNKKKTLKDLTLEIKKKKKLKGYKKIKTETINILQAVGKEDSFNKIYTISIISAALGAIFSILIKNIFLLPVITIGFMLIPYWYVKVISAKWQKAINAELETALNIITTSYNRNGNIINAIEENLDYINPPISNVFLSFYNKSQFINSNTKELLEDLKPKIENTVFHEWVDALISCQDNKSLKSTLSPIVSKLSDMRMVTAELDYHLYIPLKEYITMMVLFLSNIPLMYFINRNWFNTLFYTTQGKILISILFIVVLFCTVKVINLIKPIDYRR